MGEKEFEKKIEKYLFFFFLIVNHISSGRPRL